MFCPKCGKNNPDGSTFCQSCGSYLSSNTQNQSNDGGYNNTNGAPGGMYNGAPGGMPNGAPRPGGIPRREIALCIVFSIITCGIYGLYWLYQLTENVNTLDPDPNSMSGGMVILLCIITCDIYGWFWMYKQGERLDKLKAARGLPSGNLNIIYLLLGIFGLAIVSYALMQNEINQLIEN